MLVDRIILVTTVLLAAIYFWATAQIPSLDLGDPLGPKAFPQLLGIGLLISAFMLFIEVIRAPKNTVAAEKSNAELNDKFEHAPQTHWIIIAFALWTGLYIAWFELLGYVLATSAYLLVLMTYFNRHRTTMNVLTAVLFSFCSYLAFTVLLGVTLPSGLIPF